MKIIPKFQNSGKFPDIEKNKRKQQFLNQNGVKVKIDGSWGPWQEQQYRRLTTKNKYYHTTPLGFLSYLYDKTLGNGTTYQEDPAIVKGYSGEIKPDNRSAIRRYLDQQMQDNKTPLGYITQTILPSAAVSGVLLYGTPAITQGIRTAIANPSTVFPALKTATKEGVKGAIGATVVNAASKATTGKTWGEQVAQSTGVSSDLGEFTNPGFALGSKVINKASGLYDNYLDLLSLRKFLSRYQYNYIKPKTSIIFNSPKLDKVFNHIVDTHNTFTRGVDPYEAIKFGRFPKNSNIEEVAKYSLTHIPAPTATNTGGLLPGEAALYTSNSIGLAQRYTNGNGYIGILRRPIKYGFKTRRDFLHGNDFRFNPIPNNRFSITTDFPKDFRPWTIKQPRVSSRNPRKYSGRIPRYILTPQNSFQVRANAGALPIKNTNRTDDHFRHYLFVGNPGEQPLQLIRMYPYKGFKGISDHDYTSIGLSHKK